MVATLVLSLYPYYSTIFIKINTNLKHLYNRGAFLLQGGIKMNVDVLQTLINSLGFPIVMVGACGFFIWKMYQAQLQDKERLYTELSRAIASNDKMAEIISEHTNKLDAIQEDVKEIKGKVGA